MTSKWMMEPINRELAKKQWNELLKRRTQLRRLRRKYPSTPRYQAKLEVYKLFFQANKEISKIVIQYLKSKVDDEVLHWFLNLESYFLYKPEIEKHKICHNAKRLCYKCQEPECELQGIPTAEKKKKELNK